VQANLNFVVREIVGAGSGMLVDLFFSQRLGRRDRDSQATGCNYDIAASTNWCGEWDIRPDFRPDFEPTGVG